MEIKESVENTVNKTLYMLLKQRLSIHQIDWTLHWKFSNRNSVDKSIVLPTYLSTLVYIHLEKSATLSKLFKKQLEIELLLYEQYQKKYKQLQFQNIK